MKKIASGDGWFDIQMSAEERASLLHGLKFALKNFESLGQLEIGDPKFIKQGIRVLTEKSKPTKNGFISRMDMYEYGLISDTLWGTLGPTDAKLIDVAKLDPTLDIEKLRAAEMAFKAAMPENERKPELYPKELRQFFSGTRQGSPNGKNSP